MSSDAPATHEEFARENGLTFPLISDEEGKLQKLYGVGRAVFVIDKAGAIRHMQRGFPDTRKLLEILARLQKDS